MAATIYHRFAAPLRVDGNDRDIYVDPANPQMTTANGAQSSTDAAMGVSMIFSDRGENSLRRAHIFFAKRNFPSCYITGNPVGISPVKIGPRKKFSSGWHVNVHPTQSMPVAELDSIARCQNVGGRVWSVCNLKAGAEEEGSDFWDEVIGEPLLNAAFILLREAALAPDSEKIDENERFCGVLMMEEIMSTWLAERSNHDFDYEGFLCDLAQRSRGMFENLFMLGRKLHEFGNQRTVIMTAMIMELIGCNLVLFSASSTVDVPEEAADAFLTDDAERSLVVDWSNVDAVLRLPSKLRARYIRATAKNDMGHVKTLEGLTVESSQPSAFSALHKVLDAGAVVEAVAGSLSLKFFSVPRILASDLSEELMNEENTTAARLLLAYIWNHCSGLAQADRQNLIKASVIDIQEASDHSSLNEPKYPTLAPSLSMRSYVSFWIAPPGCRNGSAGKKHTAHMSHYITMLRREVWGLCDSHKVLFLSKRVPINLESVFEVRTSGHENSRLWASHAARRFSFSTGQHDVTAARGVLTPETDDCYFCLFTWDSSGFHRLAQEAITKYMRKVFDDCQLVASHMMLPVVTSDSE